MQVEELVLFLVRNLIEDPESVSVKLLEDDDLITVEVLISEDDMGRVIGRKGKTSNAIRTIVQAAAYNSGLKKIKININSF